MTEVPLTGGWMNDVVRVGDTVRRTSHGPRARNDFVARLLQHLAEVGWSGAPRIHSVTEDGAQILSFIEGYVPWETTPPADVYSAPALTRVAELTREFHDLTAGTPLAGCHEVAGHLDLMPGNTVYRNSGSGLLPIAFIDWDNAGPTDRIMDVAQLCWQFGGLGPQSHLSEAIDRVRLICDAYGPLDRPALIWAVLWWQHHTYQWLTIASSTGAVNHAAPDANSAVNSVRDAMNWVVRHRRQLEKAVR